MLQELRIAVSVLVVMTIVTGGIYPLVVTVVAQTVFPKQANGSLIVIDGKPVGSALIGQSFAKPEYFWGRLSATAPVPYHAASSSGSNLGPLNPAIKTAAQGRLDALKAAGSTGEHVPADLVTASGSGLDPQISPAAAEFQVSRVAAARKMSQVRVRELVRQHTEGRQLGVLGEPRVNVLPLNLALDQASRS